MALLLAASLMALVGASVAWQRALLASPELRCSVKEFFIGASWLSANLLSAWHLASRRRGTLGAARPRLDCSDGVIRVRVLRWHYADAARYPVTDSQRVPRATRECAAWCDVQEIFAPAALSAHGELADGDAHVVMLSPHDHGRAFTREWCVHAYPAPFEAHVASPGATRWAAYTYENVAQFPMRAFNYNCLNARGVVGLTCAAVADPKVSRHVDLTVNYRADADVPVTWMCAEDGGPQFGDYFRAPPSHKPHLVSLVASRCRNDWTGYVSALDAALVRLQRAGQDQGSPLVKYGTCFDGSRAIPCLNRTAHGGCVSGWYENKIAELSLSRFTLVFENTRGIDDYVTEKLSHALLAGSVPVIWGAPNVRGWLPSPDCCVVVSGTPLEHSPDQLAALLMRYSGTDEATTRAYEERFFAWKRGPRLPSFTRAMQRCYLRAGCRVCAWAKAHACAV